MIMEQKAVEALRKKMNIIMKDNGIEIRQVVSGPRDLVRNLPKFIGQTPKDKTLVVIETKGDVVSAIKFVDISDECIGDAIKNVNKIRNKKDPVIFVLYVKKPDAYKDLASDLMEKFNGKAHVRDVLYVKNNRWGSYICYDRGCCPKAGNKID